MRLDDTHPENTLIRAHLVSRYPHALPLTLPTDHSRPYLELGCHPDVVVRVWEALGKALPVDCRAVVYGTPALVHSELGVVLALAYGTAYALRLSSQRYPEALLAGCHVKQTWAGGQVTDARKSFGPSWVFGDWLDQEAAWIRESYDEFQP